MMSKKSTLRVNDFTFEIDTENVLGYFVLGAVLLLIFGPGALVVLGLLIIAGHLLEWDGDCFASEDSDQPKRKNSETIAPPPTPFG